MFAEVRLLEDSGFFAHVTYFGALNSVLETSHFCFLISFSLYLSVHLVPFTVISILNLFLQPHFANKLITPNHLTNFFSIWISRKNLKQNIFKI